MNEYKNALKAIGGLSNPSKMPCNSWSIPATKCGVGGVLVKVPGSVCGCCYALDGRYLMHNVRDAMERRWQILQRALNDSWYEHEYICSFITVLAHLRYRTRGKQHAHFRWFDSGDLVNVKHLGMIVAIAKALPAVKFWLPTREYRTVKSYTSSEPFPSNLTVRVSAAMINGKFPDLGLPVSGVHTGSLSKGVFECPAYKQDGACDGKNQKCRACWSPNASAISYPLH